MLSINFYAESDDINLVEAAKEYSEIWEQDGRRITSTIEAISGFPFHENVINALVFEGRSYSHPLQLRASYTLQTKKNALIHELCHRISRKDRLRFDYPDGQQLLEVHKIIFLILYDILADLYGKEFADANVQEESVYSNEYKEAWEWALSMTRDERKKKYDSLKIS